MTVKNTSSRGWLIGVIVLAALIRLWAALTLPLDFDEPVYVGAALDYARLIRQGDWAGVIDYPGNRQHPALHKLIYTAGALALGDAANSTTTLYVSRIMAALFGVAAVAGLAWFAGPLAAGLLAVHTLTVKYTAQAYLEAWPLMWSILAVGAWERAGQPGIARARYWLLCGAVAWGLATAAKMNYAIVAAPAMLAWLIGRGYARQIPLLSGVALLTFVAANPTVWREPLERFAAMASFWAAYSQGQEVQAAGYPWYQPIIWLATAPAVEWHPEVFFLPGLDPWFTLLALIGLPVAWRDPARRYLAIWLLSGLLILLIWPTKWPQYALTLVTPIVLLAAPIARRGIEWLREQNEYWGWSNVMFLRPPRYAWIALALLVGFVATVYATALIMVTAGSIGWSVIAPGAGGLPPGPIYAIQPLRDGRVALGGEHGLTIWEAPAVSEDPPRWNHLPLGMVYDMAETDTGLWVATRHGLALIAAGERWEWQPLPAGLREHAVARALASAPDGTLWLGTNAGGAARDAHGHWQLLPQAGRGGMILSVAVGQHGEVWFGGIGVVSRYLSHSNVWQHFDRADGFAGAGIADLLIDQTGTVWAATLGEGLARWDGTRWEWLTTANRQLPAQTITTLLETDPGQIWIGAARPLTTGGFLLRYDGQTWRNFLPRDSGFPGAEPLALAVDHRRVLWIGTRANGVVTYQLGPVP
ncbi:transcriptional regulator [Chloroflexus sp.]|uniref:transcriptional regulator n=1 Tax=Chloroflexus sp. TaxID=1904827 RepID=UPI002613FCD2|nr:transcriptional regulator [uncultured Chloroflexus sp.]